MQSTMTLGRKLSLCFVSTLVAALGLGYTNWSSMGKIGRLLDSAANDNVARKLALCAELERGFAEMTSLERAIALDTAAGQPAAVERYKQAFVQTSAGVEKGLQELRPLLLSDISRQAVVSAQSNLASWLTAHQAIFHGVRNAKDAKSMAASITERILPLEATARALVEKVPQVQINLNRASSAEAADSISVARWITLAILAVCLLFAGVALFVVRASNLVLHEIAAKMAEGAEQVSSAATQISSSSESLAQGSSQQAASLEETSSSSEEISSMTQKNTENSRIAAEVVVQAGLKFQEADQKLAHLVGAMGEINNQSEKISKIIKVIDEIAFQTNILALNAAVEAARAGEAGMGFAVVADEVRNLAQRCAQAAKDTAALIEESVGKSQSGQQGVDQVVVVIRAVSEQAAQVKVLVDEVHMGSAEQARGIQQIAKAIAQIEQVTQKTAANAEESASASQQLSAQAQSMKSVVVELQELVGGAARAIRSIRSALWLSAANPAGSLRLRRIKSRQRPR